MDINGFLALWLLTGCGQWEAPRRWKGGRRGCSSFLGSLLPACCALERSAFLSEHGFCWEVPAPQPFFGPKAFSPPIPS